MAPPPPPPLPRLLPRPLVLETDIEELSRAVRVLRSVVVVNLGHEASTYHARAGKHLASNRTDAFSYGGMYECLVHSIDQVVVTSWKEVIASHHEGIEAILQSIGHYMQWMPPSRGVAPPLPTVLCFGSNHKMAIVQRIERLYSDIFDCFYRGADARESRYIFRVEHAYYVVEMEEETLRHRRLPDQAALIGYLGRGRTTFGRVVLDRNALNDSLLPLIYKFNKPAVVQFFYRDSGGSLELYVLDEHGSLFHDRNALGGGEHFLSHYRAFFDNVLQRQYFQLADFLDERSDGIQIEFHRLGRDGRGQWQVKRVEIAREPPRKGYFDVQVLAEEDESGEPLFTIYCGEREFSSLEHGPRLFDEVARHIVAQRRGGATYPIFITDLDLPPAMFDQYGGGAVPTVEFLGHKREIERRLNEALERHRQPAPPVRQLRPPRA